VIPHFEKANLKRKELIDSWLDEPHVKEFWDNSPEHRQDILIFMNGRKEPSVYWNGIFTYWIGSINDQPYCLFLTAECFPDQHCPPLWKEYISNTGSTYTIDFCIGNRDHLGKGLAAVTLDAFTVFFQAQVDNKADTFFIDPDVNNPRAKHVYEKAGFKLAGHFKMAEGFFDGHDTYLLVKKLKA